MLTIVSMFLIVAGAVFFYFGMRRARLRRLIAETQTSRVSDARPGRLVELKGAVECEAPLKTPYGGIDCVWYSYKLERRERRYFYRGGRRQSRTHWKTLADETNYTSFRLRDESGAIDIHVGTAKVEAPRVTEQYIGAGQNLGGFLGAVAGVLSSLSSTGDERVREEAIKVGDTVYCLGEVRGQGGSRFIGKGAHGVFFISYKREEQLLRGLGWSSWCLRVLGAVSAAAGVVGVAYSLA